MTRLVLGSSSPARLTVLKNAGIDPEVLLPTVDEEALTRAAKASNPTLTASELVLLLAKAKGESVASNPASKGGLVLGGDSALEFDGEILGKPHLPEVAIERWKKMRGKSGVLHSGHWLIDNRESGRGVGQVSSTVVHFSDISDQEILDYVSTGEPLKVAGAFTIDGLGGAFLEGIEGDAHTVIGLSLKVLRQLCTELEVHYPSLWR
jgi:septum formation protein